MNFETEIGRWSFCLWSKIIRGWSLLHQRDFLDVNQKDHKTFFFSGVLELNFFKFIRREAIILLTHSAASDGD